MADTTTMSKTTFPARGKVTSKTNDLVKFAPSNTNYEFDLTAPNYSGPINTLMDGIIRVVARKAYTVPSGGNFISPIYGSPRTIQGRVRAVNGNQIIIHAGTSIVVQMPSESSAVELANGSITVGSLVNVVALPGATFEVA